MDIIRGLLNLKPDQLGSVATIGNFDGVHLAHQGILQHTVKQAQRLQTLSTTILFEPQPLEYLSDEPPPRIQPLRDKLAVIQEQAIDQVLCLRFDEKLRQQQAAEFVQSVLVKGLGIKHLIVGDDFRFGCARDGDFSYLQTCGQQFGFTVENTPTFTLIGERVSSTRIRQALQCGNLRLAERLLGHSYQLTGRVIHGRKLGRQLGVPTANIDIHLPKPALQGVLAVSVEGVPGHPILYGVANLGRKPTVSGLKTSLEVHLLNFNASIYGERLRVTFHQKLRDEKSFENIEQLKAQILADIQLADEYFATSLK